MMKELFQTQKYMTTKHHEVIEQSRDTPPDGQTVSPKKLKSRRETTPTKVIPPPEQQRTWLVRYAVSNVGLLADSRTLTNYGLVEAPDIKAAELEALFNHVPEGFSGLPPHAPEDNEWGQWTTWAGFRAFELSDKHADVDAGSVFWIEGLYEVDAGDAPILSKYLSRNLTWEQIEAEKNEQTYRRGVVGEDS